MPSVKISRESVIFRVVSHVCFHIVSYTCFSFLASRVNWGVSKTWYWLSSTPFLLCVFAKDSQQTHVDYIPTNIQEVVCTSALPNNHHQYTSKSIIMSLTVLMWRRVVLTSGGGSVVVLTQNLLWWWGRPSAVISHECCPPSSLENISKHCHVCVCVCVNLPKYSYIGWPLYSYSVGLGVLRFTDMRREVYLCDVWRREWR